MIRRRIEYVIDCDAKHIGMECKGSYGASAFGDETMADCIASAEQNGWKRISLRFWLCPDCAKSVEREKEKQV